LFEKDSLRLTKSDKIKMMVIKDIIISKVTMVLLSMPTGVISPKPKFEKLSKLK
jgi:hypothetical protein